jgi:uncharacterized protein (DUF1800 family)
MLSLNHFRSIVLGAAATFAGLTTTSASAQLSALDATSAVTGVSYVAAGRLLNQATFGPTINDIYGVQALGLNGWIQNQINMPAYQMPVPMPASYANVGDCGGWNCAPEYWWWSEALWGKDQLRQRVAYALSKLFVVSYTEVDPRYFPYYLNALSRDAFGNWQQLMMDVSLSPAMGQMLNATNSLYSPSVPHADENFSRELMQLFSIGVVQLNNDGTPKLDGNGNGIPNYTSAQVQDLGRAFTGWTLAGDLDGSNGCPVPDGPVYSGWAWPWGQSCPMVAMPQYHDPGQKTVVGGVVIPAGQTPQQDWAAGIQAVFNNPSLPPFVSKRLIQNLVKSNPSPAYVNRVANVFINDGRGNRGNLAAVIPAILLDQEARADDNGQVSDANTGLLRDPVLEYTSVLRGMNAVSNMGFPNVVVYAGHLDVYLSDLLETPHMAPSVFSFYSPTNSLIVPGTNTSLLAPEFQLESVLTIPYMIEHMQDAINSDWNMSGSSAQELIVNTAGGSLFSNFFAQYGEDEVLWGLNQLMMHGTMSSEMMSTIKQGISQDTTPSDKIRDAIFLIVTSPQYRVMI